MTAVKTVALFALTVSAMALLGTEVAGAEDDTAAIRQEMKELGLKYDSAWELYQALVEEADGGEPLTWRHVPDWRGVYTRTKGGTTFDPDGPPQGERSTRSPAW